MIGEFIQINAFMEAVEKLKGSCCRDENFRNGQTTLQLIWDNFSINLEQLINEQESADKLSTFIRIAQNNLTYFANKLYRVKLELQPCSDGCKFGMREVLKEISVSLIKTIIALQINYPEHFDNTVSVPLLVIKNNDEINPQHVQIIRLLEKMNVEAALVKILDSFLNSLHVPGDSKIKSWRQFFYMKNLVNELLIFIESPSTYDDNMRLIRLLVGFNFNPLAFYDYMVEYISTQVNSDLPYEEQELELILLLKTFDTIRTEVKSGYGDEVPSIKESISHYISKELDTLSRMKEVMSYPIELDKGKTSPYYFDVSATIEELFFLLKVMTEVRFIKAKFKANLYTFVSRHIRTSRTKNPSAQYMRNIYGPNREVPLRIIRQIRSWLAVMIAYIDKNYGDKLKLCFVWTIGFTFLYELWVNTGLIS